jgi:carboxypeptidase D
MLIIFVSSQYEISQVGREILVNLIDLICSQYQNQESSPESLRITKLIDTTDIYIIPSMNPDGFEQGSRGNANGYDLNRNFPDLRFPGRESTPTQPEVAAVMNFISSRHFVLSANFHGGSVVANYPYDGNVNFQSGNYEATEDDPVFRNLALRYSFYHTNMHFSAEFPNGITNGAQWYVLYGGMQDYNYVKHGIMEITVELSEDKYPMQNLLASKFWPENQNALIAYLESVHTSAFHGSVLDSHRNPLSAVIDLVYLGGSVSAWSPISVTTDPVTGGWYRFMLPVGTYRITAMADGFLPQSVVLQIVDSLPLPYKSIQVVPFVLEKP